MSLPQCFSGFSFLITMMNFWTYTKIYVSITQIVVNVRHLTVGSGLGQVVVGPQ